MVIDAQDLHKHYLLPRPRPRGQGLAAWLFPQPQRLDAVKGLSLRIEAGERVAVIGPTDAGKSITLKMLSGIPEPGSGTALVHGLVPWRDRRVLARRIGVVFRRGLRRYRRGETPAG